MKFNFAFIFLLIALLSFFNVANAQFRRFPDDDGDDDEDDDDAFEDAMKEYRRRARFGMFGPLGWSK